MSTVLPPRYIGMTRLRARLTEMIDLTLQGRERVMICRHGKPVVALVTMDELQRIWADEDYELYGPVNPETGKRYGWKWVQDTGWKRPLFEAEVIAKQAAEKAEEQEMLTRIEAEIKSWEEEDTETEQPSEGSAEDARPVWWKRWW
ncbi:type II toxin-antitoxin system Phd/YefM family antitoxin [Aliiroseovarius crassostreae]|uniref:type II toxin-antitoxin system Phd/YefM family antitoxin n=1 Tax=Aliiroseovarius crassostreae TaxID=154981 RepID=UPI002206EB7B|nr:type II toxin-antitoxin system Phd/YefM family antitoxin [Aliiroseovarius crassostreae]UWQ07343.1 type II toxin-antitoxin system Phd/YefM family antitoxin [Aliiroseovarius crassostreae]